MGGKGIHGVHSGFIALFFSKYVRSPSYGIFSLFYPSAIIIGFGLLIQNPPSVLFGGKRFLDYYSPEIIILSLSVYGLLLFPIDLLQSGLEKKSGGMTRNALNGFCYVALHLFISLCGILALFLCGAMFFKIQLPTRMGLFLIALAALQMVFFSFGVFFNQLSRETSNILVWSFSFFIVNIIFGFGTLAFSKIGIFQLILQPFALDLAEWLPMTFAIRIARYFYNNKTVLCEGDVLKAFLYALVLFTSAWLIAWARQKRRAKLSRAEPRDGRVT